tara:strand:- start:18111 stop:18566 length:456 start_codon:yes stop_codon:yes gene_type:complete
MFPYYVVQLNKAVPFILNPIFIDANGILLIDASKNIRNFFLQPRFMCIPLIYVYRLHFWEVSHNQVVTWVAMMFIVIKIVYPSSTTLSSEQVDVTKPDWIMGIMFSIFPVSWAVISFLSGFLQSFRDAAPLTLGAVGMLVNIKQCCVQRFK